MKTKNLKKVLLASVLSLGLIFFIGCKEKGDSSILKLSHNHATGYPVDIAYKKFAEIIEQKSEGKYKIQIYPSAQLGEQKASMELLKSDVIQFAHVSTAILESFDSLYSVFNLPYLHRDYQHYVDVMRSEGMQKYYESSLDKGFAVITFIEAGSRNIYTKSKPVNKMQDLLGQKIRVIDSPSSIEMMKLFKASPTAMNLADIYTSLQKEVIDGAENNWQSYVEVGHAEVAKYYSLTEHLNLPDLLAVGAPFWNSLTDEEKQMFRDASREVEIFFAELWKESENKSREKAIKEYNVTVINPDISDFRKAVIPMHEALAKRDSKSKELIDYIKNYGL